MSDMRVLFSGSTYISGPYECPTHLGDMAYFCNAPEDIKLQRGYLPPVYAEVPEGKYIKTSHWERVGETAVQVIDELGDYAADAAVAEMQRQGAALFFKTQTPAPALGAALRQLFPEYPDAEVNRAVTAGAVGARVDALANKQRAEGDQMGYADMIALGVRLSTWFNALSAANGTDETWTLFEKYPEIMA